MKLSENCGGAVSGVMKLSDGCVEAKRELWWCGEQCGEAK